MFSRMAYLACGCLRFAASASATKTPTTNSALPPLAPLNIGITGIGFILPPLSRIQNSLPQGILHKTDRADQRVTVGQYFRL